MFQRVLLVSGLPAVLLAATIAIPPATRPPSAALAQRAPTDGPGDDLNCEDFDGAGGFRAAQDNLLATWPDDPNGLDANANGIACENYDAFAADAADADPAWVTLGLPAPGEEATATATLDPAQSPTATPLPTEVPTAIPTQPPAAPQPTPFPAAPVAPTLPPEPILPVVPTAVPRLPPVSYRQAVPAEVLARIDDCSVVSVSRRRLVATGCRDGRAVFWKQPRGEPDLKRTAVIRFINPLDRRAEPNRERPTPQP